MKVQELIDQEIASKQHKREFSGKVSASLLGQCRRRQFYSIFRVEPTNPPDERVLRVFKAGNLFHDFVQGLVVKQGYEIEKDYQDDIVSIRVDLINDEEVAEIKSVHSYKFGHLTRELKTKTLWEINPEHIMQVVLGALKFNRKKIRIIYVSKDDLCIKEFEMTVTNKYKKATEEEVSAVALLIKLGTLPEGKPRLYGDSVDKKTGLPKECFYCDYRDRCANEKA